MARLAATLIGLAALAGSSLAVTLNSTTCDSQCQRLVNLSSTYEVESRVDDAYTFYQAPSNFSTSLTPGLVLALEPATDLSGYTVPSGLTLSRLLYTSQDLNGTTIPASAYILWPYSPLPLTKKHDGAYPLVAWAHGTSGLLPACAPSNYRNLQYHFMAPYLLALQGMVVIAPDYAGLGVSNFPSGEHIGHPWLAGSAQAEDLAHAISAARAAFSGVLKSDGPFVTIGHSQGGSAVWAFAERQVAKPLKGYKGAVTIAPPTQMFDQLARAYADPSRPNATITLGVAPKLIAAVTAQFPAYNYSGMSALAYDRWVNVMGPLSGCLPTDALAYAGLLPEQLASPDWLRHPAVEAYARKTVLGGKAFAGPMLVLAGETDAIVILDILKESVDKTCKLLEGEGKHHRRTKKGGESLEFITYSGVNHFPIIQASSGKWLSWVKDRLLETGPAPKAGCTKSVVRGLRTEATFQTVGPNFLDTWASASESYKYLL